MSFIAFFICCYYFMRTQSVYKLPATVDLSLTLTHPVLLGERVRIELNYHLWKLQKSSSGLRSYNYIKNPGQKIRLGLLFMLIPKQNCSHGSGIIPLFANYLIYFLLKATTELNKHKTVASASVVALYQTFKFGTESPKLKPLLEAIL